MKRAAGSKRSTAVRRAGKRSHRSGGYQVGQETRDSIVSAAAAVLVEHGYAQLTLKRVAEAADVSVGNLNYHFRTKESLIEVLIERTLSNYSARFADLLDRNRDSEEHALGALVRWVMEDSSSREYTRLFRELWAMASHNRSIATALEQFYERSIDAAVQLLPRAPDGGARSMDRRTLVTVICLLSEGASVLFGLRERRPSEFEAARRLACNAVEAAARAG